METEFQISEISTLFAPLGLRPSLGFLPVHQPDLSVLVGVHVAGTFQYMQRQSNLPWNVLLEPLNRCSSLYAMLLTIPQRKLLQFLPLSQCRCFHPRNHSLSHFLNLCQPRCWISSSWCWKSTWKTTASMIDPILIDPTHISL